MMEGGLYVGPAGVSAALLHLADRGFWEDALIKRADGISRACARYVERRIPRDQGDKVGS